MIKPYKDALVDFKRSYWTDVLAANEGLARPSARAAGVHRTFIYKALGNLGVPYARNEKYGPGNWGDLTDE